MASTDSFMMKFLLVAENQESASVINHTFMQAGLPSMDIETGVNNVIPRLRKETSYDVILVEEKATKDVSIYISKLKANPNIARIPIVVLAPNQHDWSECSKMYDSGANLVVDTELDEATANHVCWILSSLLNFVDQFKENLKRVYG